MNQSHLPKTTDSGWQLGQIEKLSKGKLYIDTKEPIKSVHNNWYYIYFDQNRVTYQMGHYALEVIESKNLTGLLFPSGPFRNHITASL